jgi:ferredoxin
MRPAYYKKIRILFSLFFFLLASIVFLDITNNTQAILSPWLVYLQFVPSILKFLSAPTLISGGFIIILFLNIFLGRIYCSSVCPLGTMQDIISYAAKKLNKKKHFALLANYKILRYLMFSATLLSFLAGNLILIDILDPFSNTGRIFSNIVRPIALLANNLIAIVFEKLNIFAIYQIEIKSLSIALILISSGILLIIGIMSFSKGRLFCNTICPVGTILGLLAKYSFVKISINENSCNSCNLCEKVCKSGCIDKNAKQIDFERCVNCYNCFSVCPTGGITFKNALYKNSKLTERNIDLIKREFISKTFFFALGLTGLSFTQDKIIPKKTSTVPVCKKSVSSPPGSISISHFTSKCTACHLCVSSCPAQVLQPALWEYGFTGILQPYMDYSASYCIYECVICGVVCPTGAILPIGKENKKSLQIGKTTFVKENCIVETEKTECGACAEHCPTKAVKMVPYNNLHIPEVKNEYCVGCGACEHACPTIPYKAIYVEGNLIHKTAQSRPDKKIKDNVDLKSDFPF